MDEWIFKLRIVNLKLLLSCEDDTWFINIDVVEVLFDQVDSSKWFLIHSEHQLTAFYQTMSTACDSTYSITLVEWDGLRLGDVLPVTVLNDIFGKQNVFLADSLNRGFITIVPKQELLAHESAYILLVESE